MTVILGALDGEIEAFLGALANRTDQRWKATRYHTGSIDGHPVVVARSGVGKSLSAAVTQHLIDRFSPQRLVVTGIAGAVGPELEIGDTLVANDCMQYDMDATALGFKLGEVPYTGMRIFACDPTMRDAAAGYQPAAGLVRVGRILTGDRFVTGTERPEWDFLRDELNGDAVEMEGASVGLIAAYNAVPFLIVRTISDKTYTKVKIDFKAFLLQASINSLACVRHVLSTVGTD